MYQVFVNWIDEFRSISIRIKGSIQVVLWLILLMDFHATLKYVMLNGVTESEGFLIYFLNGNQQEKSNMK